MTLRETAKPVNAKFGQLLRFWREAWELTQEDLAGLVDSSPRHISRMENALVRASDQMVEKLALALNLRERDRDWFIYTATKSVDRDPLEVVSAQPDWLTETFEILTSAFGNNPAVVTDFAGIIQMTNPAWETMIAPECNHVDTTPSINSFYEGMFDASESHPPAGWGRTGSACYCHSDNQALSAQKMICSHSLKACSLSTTFPLTGRVAQQVSTHVFGSRLRTRSTASLRCSTHSASALTKLGSLQSGKTPGNYTFWYSTRRIICKVHEQRDRLSRLAHPYR